MFRKLLLLVALSTVSSGAMAVSAVTSAGVVGAVPPPPTIRCHFAPTTLSFPAPGLSTNGDFTTSSTSTMAISASALSGSACPGTGDHLIAPVITLTNAPCTGVNTPTPACTGSTGYVYDMASSFSNGAILWSEFPNPTKFHIDATTYKSAPSSSVAISAAPGGTCGATESGFKINGALTAPTSNAGDPTKLYLCLSTDTGPDTTGSFTNDILSELGGNTSMTIATAQLDTTLSKLKIS